jgi:uncharacterized protein YutE (UPF0331/DUF86 family)
METNNKLYINYDLLIEKISDIERSLTLINKMASINLNDFLKDEIIMSGAKYQLILAIEAAQSICNHLTARVAKEVPTSYADCFRILAENQIITMELSKKLISMAKFRNLLVHQYGKIDNQVVYKILHNDVKDLIQYNKELKGFLLQLRKNET